jgi:hypothetical protein
MPDCSPEARAERRRQIADLWRSIGNPATSLSDRSRSIGYATIEQRLKAIGELERLEELCDTGGRRAARIAYIPLIKGI